MSEEKQSGFGVRFRGVRGSFPTPTAGNMKYGGNTACVEIVRANGAATLVLDAGTGIHSLGHSLLKESQHDIHVLLTHFHWDHIQGLTGFLPLYRRGNRMTYYSSAAPEKLERVLAGQMAEPYFPVPFGELAAEQRFLAITETMEIDGVTVTPFALHHPGGATGYRVACDGKLVVYATDHEHGNKYADARMEEAARGADVLIYDAQYTPEMYPRRVGWGHSTWLKAAELAKHAGVRQLVLFHHDPEHDDPTMDSIVEAARAHFPNTVAAAEGLTLIA
ncbi:MAG: MBL fold metallo-hydrolase [Bryocella sp.]